jgi:hypothetical protein
VPQFVEKLGEMQERTVGPMLRKYSQTGNGFEEDDMGGEGFEHEEL